MISPDLAAKMEAVLQLIEAHELEYIDSTQPQLIPCLDETCQRILAWHVAHGTGTLVWCGMCRKLKGRRHKCKRV